MFILLNSFTIFTTKDKKSSNYSFGGGKMKVLITGGYGFIGSHVANQFYKEGYEVHILDNLLYILLSNSTNEHLPSVLQRFNDAGIVDTNEKMHTQ